MATRFERDLTLWDTLSGAHLIVIATFGAGPTGVATIEEIALMVLTETWIPVEHMSEAMLVQTLTQEARRFIKGRAGVLHWILVVVFQADLARLRTGHGPENMAVIKHMAFNLLQTASPTTSLK